MKKVRLLLYVILGGVMLTAVLWFVSWKWEAHTHFRIGNQLTYLALDSGSVGFGSYTIKGTPNGPMFVFRHRETDSLLKEYFSFSGRWHADTTPQGRYFVVPVWVATMLISILGVGITLGLFNRRRLANPYGGNNTNPPVPDELPPVEQKPAPNP